MVSEPQEQPAPARNRPHPVWWVIAASLVVVATCMVLRQDRPLVSAALGQPVRQAGARGIFAFTGQLSANTFGLFMVDVDNMTVWCYEYLEGKRTLRLAAARTWMYDRYLEEYSCEEPSPMKISQLLDEQRANKLRTRTGAVP